jgi:hypothetical protein
MFATVGDVPTQVDIMESQEVETRILQELQNRRLMETHFPMLTCFGIPDVSVTVHSHFLTYLATLGQSLGFAAVAECPIPNVSNSQWASLGSVRPDSVWFTKENNQPTAALEFERFETGDEGKLRGKVENLAIAFYQSGGLLQRTVFVYWVRSGSMPRSLKPVLRAYQEGFIRRGYDVPAPDCPLTVIKCVLRQVEDRLVISEFIPHPS